LLIERRVHREGRGVQHQRVAIGRGLGHGGRADLPAGAGLVLDDHVLAQRLAQACGAISRAMASAPPPGG
jgi:hypothetical protein